MSRKLYLTLSTSAAILALAALMLFLQPSRPAAALPAAQNEGPDSAHIAIQFAPDDMLVRQIDFTAPISGLAALEATGLDVVTQDFVWGTAVCSIEDVGCPADDCFCDPDNFWGNSYWDGSAWQDYIVGAADTELYDGAIDGWQWGPFAGDPLPPAPRFLAIQSALDWILDQQDSATGGYGTHSSSVETLLDVAANRLDAAEWRREPDGVPLIGYFVSNGDDYADQGPAQAGKLAIGLGAAEGCSPLGTKTPLDYYDPTSGAFGPGAGPQAFAMLGTRALSQTVPEAAIQYLKDFQQEDGGWAWIEGFNSDTNATALALQALIASGESSNSTALINGLNFLETAQNSDGGFPYDPDSPYGTDSDTNSTAYVVQAIYAAGQDPLAGTWVISSTNPISYLLDMQLEDGSFEYQPGFGSNLLATQQAIPALLGRSFPFEIAPAETCPAVFLPLIQE